ncbi:MAG: MC/SLC25 family protein [bacterium]
MIYLKYFQSKIRNELGHDGQTRNLVPQYKNLFTAIKQIYQQEGFKGLYKGIFISIIA